MKGVSTTFHILDTPQNNFVSSIILLFKTRLLQTRLLKILLIGR